MDKKVERKIVEGEIEYNIDFYARLACLINGVNLASTTAQKFGIDTDKSDSWIKPVALQKYVNERYGDMKYDIERFMRGEDDEIYSRD